MPKDRVLETYPSSRSVDASNDDVITPISSDKSLPGDNDQS